MFKGAVLFIKLSDTSDTMFFNSFLTIFISRKENRGCIRTTNRTIVFTITAKKAKVLRKKEFEQQSTT